MEERTVVDFRSSKFVRVTREVIENSSQLKHASDIAVYTVLCYYADNTTKELHPKIKTIAEKARCSESTVKRALRNLEEAGYIEISHRYNTFGHRASNQYRLLDPKVHNVGPKVQYDTDLGS